MTTPAEFNVDSTVQLVADQFEIALNDSAAYRNRVTAAELSSGLLAADLTPELVSHLDDGVVDELQLIGAPERMTTIARGRDAAALAVDTTAFVTYATSSDQLAAETPPDAIPGFPGLPVIPGVTTPEVLPGPWTARRIAEDLCRRVGLTCVWQSHDYVLREDFAVNGPVLLAIQSLVEPFSHFEPSKTDIWADGLNLIVRARGTAGTGLSISVHDLRVSSLTLRRSFLDIVRVLRITGSKSGSASGVAQSSNRTVVTTEETIDPVTNEVTMRVVTTELIRGLDNAVLTQTVQTFADAVTDQGIHLPMTLVSLKESVSDWDDLVLEFPNTIVNQPKEHSKVTVESGFNPAASGTAGSEQLSPMNKTTISHDYDLTGFLTLQDTKKETWDDTATPFGQVGWVLDSRESKQYRDNGAGMYQITTTQFGSDGIPGDVRRTTANGTRPGGPGRSAGRGSGGSDESVVFATVISTAPGAKDVDISNKSLLAEHMTIIAAQAAASSGKTEVEISFTASGIPWIRRGQFLQITDLVAEIDAPPYEIPIPLANALVTSARIEYKESDSPSYMTYVKASFWEA